MKELKLIEFIVEEDNNPVKTGTNLILVSIILLFLGLCLSLYLVLVLRKNRKNLLTIQDMTNPVYRIQLLLTMRYFFAMMDYVILFIYSETHSLNDIYEYSIWPLFLIQFWKLISNKDLIQISRQRVYRFDLLYRIMIITLILSVPFILISNFVISNMLLEAITFIPLILFAYLIYRMIKIESEIVVSKINKIRLEHLKNTWKYIIIHFLAWVIGNQLINQYSEDRITIILIYIFQAVIMNLSPIFIALSIYWAVFIPKRSRVRHGISDPRNFM